jgi:hypothetical protein
VTTGDLVEHFLQQFYGAESGDTVPKECSSQRSRPMPAR